MSVVPKSSFKTLYIKKFTLNEVLIFYIFSFNFFASFLLDELNLPDLLKFSSDALLVYFFLLLLTKRYFNLNNEVKILSILLLLTFLISAFVYLFNYQSIFYYIWGFRNTFRFHIAFFVFVTFVDESFALSLLKFLDFVFFTNVFVSLFQFFVLNIKQDYLGGIFGTTGGTNGFTLLFFSIVITYSLIRAFNRLESFLYCFLKCALSLLVCAMAELKFFFLVFIFILVVSALITRFSWRKLFLLIISLLLISLTVSLLTQWFGFSNFLSFDYILKLATKRNYSSDNDLNRFSAIPVLLNTIVKEPLQSIFGLGLGNCDFSDFSIFSTPFSHTYGSLNYRWFSSAILFLENGFLGLGLYFAFFVVCLILTIKKLNNKSGNPIFCQLAIIIALLAIGICFYDSSLRSDSAYLFYFALALPFIKTTEKSYNY